jgi:hypothetical protein
MARRTMQAYPEIEPKVRSTVSSLVGPEFSSSEIEILENRALDAVTMGEILKLKGMTEGKPVMLTPSQKSVIDRLISAMGHDKLGDRARSAYERAQRDGHIRVR